MKADGVPRNILEIAARPFAADEAGVYELSPERSPWTALVDALAAVLPVVRAEVRAEIANDARDMADEFQRPFADLTGDAATLRWFADRIASGGQS